MRRYARIDVSHELVLESVGLPAGTDLLDASVNRLTGAVTLLVSHRGLPDTREGDDVPRITKDQMMELLSR